MSVMMAQSAPGPIPITTQPQFTQPTNTNMRGHGHGRQPSSATRPVTQQGDQPFAAPGRNSRNPNAPRVGAVNMEPEPVHPDNNKSIPRVAVPITLSSSAQQPRVVGSSSGGPRVHAPPATTSTQRPTTSHNGAPQPSAATGFQRQPQSQQPSSSLRATASRQTEPSQPPPLFDTQAQQQQGPHPGTSGNAPSSAGPGPTASQSGNNSSNSFPHAFERWEMLSSRWEGLTGYWVSRLEGNRQELSGLPLEQEMARQITDLAAAGANLFQALIELQRLRASSERKFQRWFFETRADQERAREMSSELERTLRVERQARADSIAEASQLKIEKATAEKLAQETQRELQISKDECRRAWEELGRREDIERERTNSLREGHPTLINGVQVTPMPMPGIPSRSNSTATRPRTATGAFVPSSQADAYSDRPISGTLPPAAAQPRQNRTSQPPALHPEPDIENLPQQAAAAARASSVTPTARRSPSPTYDSHQQPTGFYQQPDATLPANPSPVGSYATNPLASPAPSGVTGVSEAFEVDEEGNIVIDEHGAPKYASRRNQEEEDMENQELEWGTYPYPDYEGQEYGGDGGNGNNQARAGSQYDSGPSTPGGGVGIGSGWENVSRHHHPTRLSDVLEEDERLTNSDGRSALG